MEQWYYGENGQRLGPIPEADLGSLIAAGRIGPATLIWREGMAEWLPLGQVSAQGGLAVLPPSGGYDLLRPATTSGFAIASMVCGIVGIVTCIFLLGIPAVICGHLSLNQIDNAPFATSGRGMAITGLALGYLQAVGIVAIIVMIVVAGLQSP